MATEGARLSEVRDGEEFDTAGPVAGGDGSAGGREADEGDGAVAGDLGAVKFEGRELRFDGFAVFDVGPEGDC